MKNRVTKSAFALVLLVVMVAGFAFAADTRTVDVQEFSVTNSDIQPRWTYMQGIDNGLNIDQYVVTVTASTDTYSLANKATVSATLQQKQANGTWLDYVTYSNEGKRGATVSESLTVPYGTYRVVSYHSAGNGDQMEYKSLVGPAKRVPFGDLA